MADGRTHFPPGERPRITVWWCDICGYWRKEHSTGVHQTTDRENPTGRMVKHDLRPVWFEMVAVERVWHRP